MRSSISSPIAELATGRLVLRPWTMTEATAVLGDTRAAHWADDFPAEGDRVIAGLFDENPAWLGEHGHRLIVERDSGLVVGSIGLFWPPSAGTLEIGYGIVPSRRGQGYAPEATRALAALALAAPGVHTVVATVELSNPASVRVLEKAGFARGAAEEDTVRFRITRPDGHRS
ncbi:GNAT family N-acetyltransferase [Streptomyces rectiverticillatus]|uniref:GNAT family N-acetyltransferase n=1 Tax=Streptomyces rectiverticillatus TaxID=173860 RepID=UPI0015C3ACF7|nr:GNAT family N-acetyltransferase [Streptomyces rectiverticillatus]QLE75764.1 GNAT family N-acetyltransferase [Streptomyces rectiverticillatus]